MKIEDDESVFYQGIEYQAVDIRVTDTLPPDEFRKRILYGTPILHWRNMWMRTAH